MKKQHKILKTDLRRMFTTSRFWIFLFVSFMLPILVLVMTGGFGGESGMTFTSAWQMISSSSETGMAMDMTMMMNSNLLYFLTGVFLCLFVADDFRSGYAKNLFTVRAGKKEYVVSKTCIGMLAGALMLLVFLIGTIIGGNIAGLPLTLSAAGFLGLVMCMISKILLMGMLVPVFLAMAVIGKQRAWLSILLALFIGMMLFMPIPMMTPLDAGPMNVLLCAAGAAMFCLVMGILSNQILKRRDLI